MCGVAQISICFAVSRPRPEEAPAMTTTEPSISWLIAGGWDPLELSSEVVVEIFVVLS
jgi:hypothetical protein